MHNVYTQPETISAYNKTGEFPDGTVLVKEVRETKADRLLTGHSAWSTDMKIWFVMIKDQQGRFEDNDHWGDGWGWALFDAKDPANNISAGYDTSCISCHIPAADTDWVYVYGYADLKPQE
jgi:cytochrome c